MKAHVYSGGKTMENQPVSFDEAMFLIEHQDTFYQDEDNFLGFTAPESEDAVLQFIREEEDKWIVDIPVVKNNEYQGSYHAIASHNQIVAMVTNFFIKNAELRRLIVGKEWDGLEQEFGHRFGLGLHFVPKQV